MAKKTAGQSRAKQTTGAKRAVARHGRSARVLRDGEGSPASTVAPPALLTEHQIQSSLCDYLMAHGIVYFAVPNAAVRSAATAVHMQREGMVAGAPDLVLCRNGRVLFLELKRPGGRMSPAQLDMQEAMLATGMKYEIAFGIDEAIEKVNSVLLAETKTTGENHDTTKPNNLDNGRGREAPASNFNRAGVVWKGRRRNRQIA